jgi:hypothetical protein
MQGFGFRNRRVEARPVGFTRDTEKLSIGGTYVNVAWP